MRAPSRRTLPILLAVAAAAASGIALFALEEALSSRAAAPSDDGAVSRNDRGGAHLAPELPDRVTSPAELRAVVRECRDATRAQVPALRRAALGSPDPLVASNALRALGRLRAVAGDAELLALLHDRRSRLRQELVVALGLEADRCSVELLEGVVGGSDPELSALALQALGRIGGPRANRIVEAVLHDPARTALERSFARAALREQDAAASARGFPPPARLGEHRAKARGSPLE